MDSQSQGTRGLVLGIDLGTSYFKAGVYDRTGTLRGLGRIPVESERHAEGRCELSVDAFWACLRRAVHAALEQAGAGHQSVKGCSYASQANSFLLLDGTGTPLTPVILWPDRRVDEVHPALASLWRQPEYLDTTGTDLATPEFCAAKLRWFQEHDPATWSRTRRIMTISDYLTFALTGRAVGDQGTASLLGMWDIRGREWWLPAMDAAEIRQCQLSAPLPSGTLAGPLTAEGADLLGLPPGSSFAVGGLDHYVAAIGAGLGRFAPVTVSIGTVLCAVRAVDKYRPRPGVCVGPGARHSGGSHRFYEFAFNSNGAPALEWYQRNEGPGVTLDELLRMAEGVVPGCEGLSFRPLGDGPPSMANFVNREANHGHGHYVRAIVESIGANLAALTERLFPEGPPDAVCATGGGARSDLLLQIAGDTLGVPFVRANCAEPACLGAAMFAAGSCWGKSVPDLPRTVP